MFSSPQEREEGGMEGGSKDSVGVTLCRYVVCACCVCIHPVVFAKSQEESTSFYLEQERHRNLITVISP